jgi:hypothetical protein
VSRRPSFRSSRPLLAARRRPIRRASVTAVVLAVLLAGGLDGSRVPPAQAASAQVVQVGSLDRPTEWAVTKGSASVYTTADEADQRIGLRITEIVGDGALELGPATGPNDIVGLPRTLQVDVQGNTGWRPLYLQVRDSTGEIFHYWIGHVANGGWETRTVDLTSPPTATMWGDRDGILDLPVSFFKIVVDRRPEAADPHVDFAIDNLRMVVEPWTPLALSRHTFMASAGERSTLSMTVSGERPFQATLRDELGRARTWDGQAAAGVQAALSWDGRDDAGALMSGSVQARLALGPPEDRQVVDVSYLGGILTRRGVDPNSIVGMNTFLSEPNPDRRAFVEWQGRRLEEARVAQIRETFVWDRIEPRKGWFEWAKFDQAVEIAEAHGVGVLGVLAFSSQWASSAPADEERYRRVLYPPTDVNDFAAYVRAVVQRYGDRIDDWEVWNEPNHPKFWLPGPNPEAYAKLLAAAAAVIRQEDPGARVVLGGIVGTDVKYLDRLRAAGAWDDFDILAIHGYVRLSPEASGLGGWFDRAVAYVEKWGRKPIWMTEICWPVSAAEPGIPAVTTANQSAFLGRTYIRAAEAGLSRVFWYSLIDHDSGSGSRYDACGLFDVKQQARPGFKALKAVGAAFENAVTVGPFDPAAGSRRDVTAASVATWSTSTGNSVKRQADGMSGTYRLASASAEVNFRTSIQLPGTPTSFVATVTGDGSANSLLAEFTDATGETCSVSLAPLRAGSRVIRVPLDGSAANWSCWSGDRDRRLDAPVRFKGVSVHPTGIGPMSGSFQLTGLEVGQGPVDRGLLLAKGGSLTLLVSRSVATTGATTSIALPGATAFELVDGTRKPLTVTAGILTLGVTPQPRAIDVPIALTHRTITPGSYTWLRWLAGDGTIARPQVMGPNGQWVRTDIAKRYPAGLRSIAWDGRLTTSSGLRVSAPRGDYVLRLVFTAPDGRTGTVQGTVTVR